MNRDDYIRRWMLTGLLNKVHPDKWGYVSARLQIAAQNQIITKDPECVEREIISLKNEGYFDFEKK